MAQSVVNVEATKNHSGYKSFSATINSVITDASASVNEGRYYPSLNMAEYHLRLISGSGKIPVANTGNIVTIPSGYRPVTTVAFMALLVPQSSSYADVRAEGSYLTPTGELRLNNFIYGTPAAKFIAVDLVYFCGN